MGRRPLPKPSSLAAGKQQEPCRNTNRRETVNGLALTRPTKGELARVGFGLARKQPVAQRRVRQKRSVRLA